MKIIKTELNKSNGRKYTISQIGDNDLFTIEWWCKDGLRHYENSSTSLSEIKKMLKFYINLRLV